MKRREYLINIGKIKNNGTIKHTYCSTFLLPTIGYSEKEFNNQFLNAYIDENLSEPQLYVIIEGNIDELSLNKIKKNPCYVEDFLSENETELIIKFKIHEKYHDIFYKYINGKYSEFDNTYKQILTEIHGRSVNTHKRLVTVFDILYPRKDKINQIAVELDVNKSLIKEVFDIPNLEYEIYKPLEQLKLQQEDNTLNG